MDNHRIAARMGTALPSLVRWGLSPDADLVYRTLVSLDTAREGQLAQELGMAHDRVREAMRELAGAGAIRKVTATSRHTSTANGRAVWAARQPNQVVRQLHVDRTRPLGLAPGADPAGPAGPDPVAVAPSLRPIDPPPAGGPAKSTCATGPAHRGDSLNQVAAQPGKASLAGADDQADPAGGQRWIPHQVPFPSAGAPGDGGNNEPGRPDDGRPADGRSSISLTPRERAIIELLAQGHTDETAARELELSRRTVGYALGGLMGRLGVDNRFQLGLALGALRAAIPSPRSKAERAVPTTS
jgi:DNA-binding CsgD family transcriptional regulator